MEKQYQRNCPNEASTCPDEQELQDFVSGILDPPSAQTVADRIDGCTECGLFASKCAQTTAATRSLASPRRVSENHSEESDDFVVSKPSDPNESGLASETQLEQLRDYQLLSEIGAGGMGKVYKARHSRLRRDVAIKVLPASLLDNDAAIARFDREMEAIGQLTHPNIVQAMDAGEEDGKHYLVLEFVDGVDAGELSRSFGPLPVAEACEIIRQAASGLHHAHCCKLIHRDIKPSNLLVSIDGEVKVADLGLALLQRPGGENELTMTGQIMGTLDYIAPEQIENTHDVDPRADLYSLGCTFYRLLVGSAPFAGTEYQSVLKKLKAHESVEPVGLRQIRSDIPKQLESIVHQLLEKKPEDRIQSAAELESDLLPFSVDANLGHLIQNRPQPKSKVASDNMRTNTHQSNSTTGTQSFAVASEAASETASFDLDSQSRGEAQKSEIQKVQQVPKRTWTKWAAAFAVCAVGLLWLVLGDQIVQLTSNKGLPVNKANDPTFLEDVNTPANDPTGMQVENAPTAEEFSPPTTPKEITDLVRWGLQQGLEIATWPHHFKTEDDLSGIEIDRVECVIVSTDKCESAAEAVSRFSKLSSLHTLRFVGNRQLNEAEIEAVHATKIQKLTLQCPVTDEQLARMPSTVSTELRLEQPNVTNETIRVVAQTFPRLKNLCVNADQLTRGGLAPLVNLPLERLQLSNLNSPISHDLLHSESLTLLKILSANEDPIRDLTFSNSLSGLDLSQSPVENKSLSTIANSKSLTWVRLKGTKVTREGVAELMRGRPDLAMETDWFGPALARQSGAYVISCGGEAMIGSEWKTDPSQFPPNKAGLIGMRVAVNKDNAQELVKIIRDQQPLRQIFLKLEASEFKTELLNQINVLPLLSILSLDGFALSETEILKVCDQHRFLLSLYLGNYELNKNIIERVSSLQKLTFFQSSSPSFDDEELSILETAEQLESLDLTGTSVTKSGIEKFQTAVPNCEIVGP